MFDFNKADAVFAAAREQFGSDHQLVVAQEELGELISAISRVKRQRPGAVENLVEELADVEVMVRQIALMFNAVAVVERIFDEKVDRLAERVAKGKDH